MPPISDRILDKEGDAQYVPDIPVMTSPFVPPLPLGPSGAPIPSRGLPPNEYITDSVIQQRNPDSPTLQRNIMGIIGGWRPFTEPIDSAPAQVVTPSVPDATASSIDPPLPVSAILAVESPYKATASGVYSLVSVEFNRAADSNFGHVNVWATGYHGSSVPELVASGTTTPISFLLETTGETVTLFAVSVSISGVSNSLVGSPFTTVLLDGVISAPSAPTIAQTLVTTLTGYQFQFNFATGLAADIIDGYAIYRHTANDPGAASRIAYIKQNAANTGVYTFQDGNAPAGTTYYYWVSKINTSGLESSLTSAQSGAIVSLAGHIANNVNVNGVYTGANPLTQSGVSATILVASSTMQYGPVQITYNSGSVNPGAYGTYYVFADDSTFVGGAVTYQASLNFYDVTASIYRVYFGKITTAGGGGGGGSGGGGGCVKKGTYIHTAGLFSVQQEPWNEWYDVETENGRFLSCVPIHPLYSDHRGRTEVQNLLVGEYIITDLGLSKVKSLRHYSEDGIKMVISVPEGFLYFANGLLSHNKEEAP